MKTKPRSVRRFRHGVLLGFVDDFWWHTMVPTMVPHLGTGGWLHKNKSLIAGRGRNPSLIAGRGGNPSLIAGRGGNPSLIAGRGRNPSLISGRGGNPSLISGRGCNHTLISWSKKKVYMVNK